MGASATLTESRSGGRESHSIMTKSYKWLKLKIKADPDSLLGQVISQLQQDPRGSREVVTDLLLMHFLAKVSSANGNEDKQMFDVAVQYAERCSAEARTAMRLLGISPTMTMMTANSCRQGNGGGSDVTYQQEEKEEEGIRLNHSSEKLFGG